MGALFMSWLLSNQDLLWQVDAATDPFLYMYMGQYLNPLKETLHV